MSALPELQVKLVMPSYLSFLLVNASVIRRSISVYLMFLKLNPFWKVLNLNFKMVPTLYSTVFKLVLMKIHYSRTSTLLYSLEVSLESLAWRERIYFPSMAASSRNKVLLWTIMPRRLASHLLSLILLTLTVLSLQKQPRISLKRTSLLWQD